jgi:hypothetical protein
MQCIRAAIVGIGVNTTQTVKIMTKKARDRLARTGIITKMTRRLNLWSNQ